MTLRIKNGNYDKYRKELIENLPLSWQAKMNVTGEGVDFMKAKFIETLFRHGIINRWQKRIM